MSSFVQRHNYYLFSLTTGKLRLGTGTDAEDAYKRLAEWHTPEEMTLVIKDQWKEIRQEEMPEYANAGRLG